LKAKAHVCNLEALTTANTSHDKGTPQNKSPPEAKIILQPNQEQKNLKVTRAYISGKSTAIQRHTPHPTPPMLEAHKNKNHYLTLKSSSSLTTSRRTSNLDTHQGIYQ
jgi:hypothetical protein